MTETESQVSPTKPFLLDPSRFIITSRELTFLTLIGIGIVTNRFAEGA